MKKNAFFIGFMLLVLPHLSYGDSLSTLIPSGTSGQVLTSRGTSDTPYWATPSGGVPTTTKGDLAGYSTTSARIPVGTDGQVLTADSTQALGLKWAAAGGGASVGIINASHDVSVTGNESYSGCGFQPKAVEVFVSQSTVMPASWAWTDGSKYVGLYSYGAVGGGGTFVNMGPSTNLIAKYVFATTSASATVVSPFDSNGVTLNWTSSGASGTYALDIFCIK